MVAEASHENKMEKQLEGQDKLIHSFVTDSDVSIIRVGQNAYFVGVCCLAHMLHTMVLCALGWRRILEKPE